MTENNLFVKKNNKTKQFKNMSFNEKTKTDIDHER